ncbi:MAG TPA: flagellin [Caulobacteraceae bacterium]|nr:flagellin [Caulobacteraceae bacterium]
MDRISTADTYAQVVANLMASQNQLTTDSNQLSSGNVASDLQGYASHAETLTAMQTVQSQVGGFLANDQVLADKLTTQNTGLQQVAGAAQSAAQAIQHALAAGVGDSLMQQLGTAFSSAVQGLNTTYNGEYVFAGGQVTTAPVTVNSLSALGAAPTIASVFANDQHVASSQINQNTTVQTGFLADQLGTPLMTALQAIQNFSTGPGGPFTGQLTTAQIGFLTTQMNNLTAATDALNTSAAQNGLVQDQVTNAQSDLSNQQTTLGNMLGGITNANMAQVSANLQQAQLAMQASSQVFLALNNSSLLNVLTAAGQ